MQEIENLYELLFENIKEGIVIVNSSGVIEKVNKRLETIFGYDPEELIGKNLEILVPNSFR